MGADGPANLRIIKQISASHTPDFWFDNQDNFIDKVNQLNQL